jgi:hypothetical protein
VQITNTNASIIIVEAHIFASFLIVFIILSPFFCFRYFCLETWAIEYPEIWGNDKGRVIFCSVEAFGKKFKDKITHNDIIIHLRGVYERWVEFLMSLATMLIRPAKQPGVPHAGFFMLDMSTLLFLM